MRLGFDENTPEHRGFLFGFTWVFTFDCTFGIERGLSMGDRIEDNTELFEKAVSGDVSSFEKFIINYEKLIYNIAYRIMGNQEDAMDMSQEAMLKIYRNISKCVDITHFKRWLYTVVNNCCLDELRKRKHRVHYSLDSAIETDDGSIERQFISPERTPEQLLVNKELSSDIKKAINDLSIVHKSVIVLRDINGLSYEELAEITGCNIGTVKSRLARARDRLKTILIQNAELNNGNGVNKSNNPKKMQKKERR